MRSKYFEELSTNELYEILRARAEIFVVEQNCVYQDLDGIDYESLHVFAEEGGKVTAYLRAFYKDEDTVQMGRVLTLRHGEGLGGKLLREGIAGGIPNLFRGVPGRWDPACEDGFVRGDLWGSLSPGGDKLPQSSFVQRGKNGI